MSFEVLYIISNTTAGELQAYPLFLERAKRGDLQRNIIITVNGFIAIAGADQDEPRPPLFNKEAIKKTVKSLGDSPTTLIRQQRDGQIVDFCGNHLFFTSLPSLRCVFLSPTRSGANPVPARLARISSSDMYSLSSMESTISIVSYLLRSSSV